MRTSIAKPKLNPYKFRLWLDSVKTGVLNARQKHLLLHILSWGKVGCDSWNYRLAKEMKCSERTITSDLRRLERYGFIENWGALGKHRRLIALPFPSKRAWRAALAEKCIQRVAKKLCPRMFSKPNNFTNRLPERGEKNCDHQRRIYKDYIYIAQQQRNALLYGEQKKAESAETADKVLPRGVPPRTPPAAQEFSDPAFEKGRIWLIKNLMSRGWSRERAISFADAHLER